MVLAQRVSRRVRVPVRLHRGRGWRQRTGLRGQLQPVANADQRDVDGDEFGNVCDPDLNNDGVVNALDLGLLRARFSRRSGRGFQRRRRRQYGRPRHPQDDILRAARAQRRDALTQEEGAQ